MIALIPPVFLILSGLGVILLAQVRKGLGLPWLLASLAALGAWAVTLAFHWLSPGPVYIIGWNPLEPFVNIISFRLDLISWPYSLALATLTLAVLFTSAARIESTVAGIWGLDLIFGGLGILAVMAASPVTFVLVWALIDLGEFLVLYRTVNQPGRMRPLILSFAVQIASLFLVLLGMMVSRWKGLELNFNQLPYQAGILLFFGALLRLGVFPRHLPYPADFRFKRDFGTLLRGIQPATGLVLLARLPDLNIPTGGLGLLKLFLAVAALYGSLRWAASDDESSMHPYWAIGTAGLAMLAVLNGYQITSVIWGLILILIGGVLGLYSSRDARIQYIPVLAVLGILGLPFTPAAGGWLGLADQPVSIFTFFSFAIHLVLVVGLVRHLFKPGEPYASLERWIRVMYPAGLLALILAQWVVATWGWPGSYTAGVWWAGVIPAVLLVLGYFLWTNTAIRERYTERFLRLKYLLKRYFFTPLDAILRAKWLVDLLGVVFALADRTVHLLSRLLEGEGGFLWVLFLLAMIVMAVMTSGGA